MKKITILANTLLAISLFSGCSSRYLNKQFHSQVVNGVKHAQGDAERKHFASEEQSVDTEYLNLSVPQDLEGALAKIGNIEKRVYILKRDSNNVFPLHELTLADSIKLHIDTFLKLKKYIEDTTNYTIKITKNKFSKRAKIVEVFDKMALKTSLSNFNFTMKGKGTVSDALQKIAEMTHFSIIYNNNLDSNVQNTTNGVVLNNQTVENELNSKKIYYTGKNVALFLDYVSDMFNVYIDIDYRNKAIKISKYKSKMFYILIPEYKSTVQAAQMGGTTSAASTSGSPGGSSTTGGSLETSTGVESTVNIATVSDFLKGLKELVSDDSNSKILYNPSGMLTIKTTKRNMEIVSKMISKYNSLYSKQINVVFDEYEFLLSRDFNFGIDLSYKSTTSNIATNYISNYIFSYGKKLNTGATIGGKLNVDNEFITFVKKYKYETRFTNNIPLSINFTTNTDYVKSITSTTTAGTTPITTTSNEIGTITDGQTMTLLPKIFGNKVFIKSELKINTLNSMNQQNIGDTLVTLPDVSVKTIPSTVIMRIGEKKVIGYYETYESANKYNGIIPIRSFIIGGKNDKKYVRKLVVIVAKLQAIK